MQNSGFWAIGRVIRTSFKSADDNKIGKDILELTISINTSRRKKDNEQYSPSFLVKTTLWESVAVAVNNKIETGSKVHISGELGVPEGYINKNDEIVSIVVIDRPNLQILDSNNNSGDTKSNSKSTSSKKTSSTKKKQTTPPKPAKSDDDDFGDVDSLFDETEGATKKDETFDDFDFD